MAEQLPVNANATIEAIRLQSYLNSLMSPDAGLLTGQHNWLESPMGNINTLALPNSGGRYPAVIGLEVGAIEGQTAAKLYNQRAEVASTAISYWNDGGIPTIMWHCTYPLMPYQWVGGVQRSTTQEEFDQILTPGDPKFNWLIAEMDAIAVHFRMLYDAKVPILFRPWHEMNGYWFWWGNKTNLSTLWNLTYDRFVNYHGLDNILWVWNPNCMKATDPNISNYKLYYPGHDKVDILAWDIYLGEFSQSFHDDLFAFGGGKPIALGEVGRLPDMNTMKASQWRYTWAMDWGEPNFSGENTSANKQQFFSHPYAITRDEVNIPPIVGPPPDTVAPSAPSNLVVTSKTSASVSLSWSASTDNVGVTGYEVMSSGNVVGATASTSITVTGLLANTTYTFTVRAKDAAGNISTPSAPVTGTTSPSGGGEGDAKFVKGINFNGGVVTIEGNAWLAESMAGITATGVQRYTGGTVFNPPVDASTNAMLNSDIFSKGAFNVVQALPNGTYQIYLWTAENYKTNFRSFHVKLEGKQATSAPIGSMPQGEWRKYGPYTVTVNDGTLNMDIVRVDGDTSLSGMAIYTVGTPLSGTFVKGINYNGGAVTIEGNAWLAESMAGITATGILRYTGGTVFNPPVDASTSMMLNSDIYARGAFSVTQLLANGTYQIYLWTAENYRTNFRSFHVKLEGKQVTASPIGVMPLGQWRKYGPYPVIVTDGALNMDVVRVTGDPSLSGMAIYRIE